MTGAACMSIRITISCNYNYLSFIPVLHSEDRIFIAISVILSYTDFNILKVHDIRAPIFGALIFFCRDAKVISGEESFQGSLFCHLRTGG